MPDYYAVLGVPKTATKDDIKKAYRKAALKTHPDRVPADQKKAAEDAFRSVTAAYEILADDKNKALYDKNGGQWPPPSSSSTSTSNSTSYKPRQPEYKPFGTTTQPSQPFFDDGGASFHGFVFTDPFVIFNTHFGPEYFQAHFHAAHPHSRPLRTPVPMFDGQPYPQQQPMFQQQFQSFAQAGASASYTSSSNTTTPTSAKSASTAKTTPPSRSESTSASAPVLPVSVKDNEDRGWIKESKVTKVTPSGTRETTVKKTAADGTVYITRIGGDGIIRHWVFANGVETPTDKATPEFAPGHRVPLSQTQPQVPPSQPRPAYTSVPQPQQQSSSSSRHSPSASQPVNSAYDAQAAYSRSAYTQPPASGIDPHRRSASRAGHHERSASRAGHHERSASRAGHHERPHRAASPPPVPPKESKMTTPAPSPTGNYPFAYPQAPLASAPPRVKSPSPRQEAGRTSDREREREREKEKDLRRNHTVPSHVLPAHAQAQPHMPRPQSPHFYRTRSGSEAPNPSPTKMAPSSAAQQQPRPRYDSTTGGQPVRLTEEPTSYVFSDTEAAARLNRSTSSYKPTRSSSTVPAPGHAPMTQGVPIAPPAGVAAAVAAAAAPPRRSSSRYGHSHSQSAQGIPIAPPMRHHSVPVPPPLQMQCTNELGLGFVPPPSSGLGSNRNSGASSTPNPTLGRDSRNASYEEIVYASGSGKPKSSSRSQQQPVYGNPVPQPPVYREPWTAEAQQQARYRQAAA